MKESQVIDGLGALSHETRLRMVRHLISQGVQGAAAGAVGKVVKASPSKVSFHLAALEQAGLVTSRRASRQIIYRADFKRIGNLISYLLSDCCQNNPEILSCCDRDKTGHCC